MGRGGVAATSLDAVRAATGTSKSQLYHYFEDKGDLVRAVVRYQADELLAAQHLEDDPPDTPAGLRRWRYRVVGAQRERGFAAGCPLGSLVAELVGAVGTDDATLAEIAAAFRRWHDLLARALRRGVEAGAFPGTVDPDADAEALVAAVQGGSLLAAVADSPAPLQAALDRAIATVLPPVALER
jgi:TetR/AcrR family transcriptional repressor of nem operon